MDETGFAPVVKPAQIVLQEGNNFIEYISSNDEQYYRQFIKTSFAEWKYNDALKNTLQPSEPTIFNKLHVRIYPVDKHDERMSIHENVVNHVLNTGQKIAYSKVCRNYIATVTLLVMSK
jgi:hypothetical protein